MDHLGGLIQREDVGRLYLNVKEIVKFDISNASPLLEQIVVLLSSFGYMSSGGLGATLLVMACKHKKKNRNIESVGKMFTEKSCSQKSKTKRHENHYNLSYFLSLGCRIF